MHAGEVSTDAALARRLLAAQMPQWADLPIRPVSSYGTDHAIYRLGDDLAVRMPRIDWAAAQAAKEAEWLPRLAPHVPLALPVPREIGEPGEGYPFRWAVYEWLPGHDLTHPVDDLEQVAMDLAAFVRALRGVDTTGAFPRDVGARGSPHADRDDDVRRRIAELGDRIDGKAALRCWEQSLEAAAWESDVWVHGDLLPGNLLVVAGRLSAVIDFGGLNVGDPACDLQPAWNVFAGASRARFLADVGVDDAALARGRGWVVSQTVMALPYYWDSNAAIVRQASRALSEVLADC
ncbi:MAG TPA: aminoglycoside phosphotransferase family protein [Mycobacteriales bacterium]|nr:aminoglycoside phosphotransferase family protein [Mycobacteriales bacterium]